MYSGSIYIYNTEYALGGLSRRFTSYSWGVRVVFRHIHEANLQTFVWPIGRSRQRAGGRRGGEFFGASTAPHLVRARGRVRPGDRQNCDFGAKWILMRHETLFAFVWPNGRSRSPTVGCLCLEILRCVERAAFESRPTSRSTGGSKKLFLVQNEYWWGTKTSTSSVSIVSYFEEYFPIFLQ